MLSDNQTYEILHNARTIAIVGLSNNPERPSYGVARYLVRNGYQVIPVNPRLKAPVLGVMPVASLYDIPQHVDIVCVFRRSEFVLPIAEAAVAIGADTLWLQLDVINHAAADVAQAAGLAVVMDRCIAVDHRRLSRYAEAAEALVS